MSTFSTLYHLDTYLSSYISIYVLSRKSSKPDCNRSNTIFYQQKVEQITNKSRSCVHAMCYGKTTFVDKWQRGKQGLSCYQFVIVNFPPILVFTSRKVNSIQRMMYCCFRNLRNIQLYNTYLHIGA